MRAPGIGLRWRLVALSWQGVVALGVWLCCGPRADAGLEARAAGTSDGSSGSLSWLLSDKGPFHQALEFTESVERYQQGFSTRYKIYREFGRWKVSSLAAEKWDTIGGGGLAPPLDPDFTHAIRQLGRRPSLQAITQNIIRKYGTHILLSATLGGEESLTIFVDKRKLSQELLPPVADGDSDTGANGNGSLGGAGPISLEALHQLAASYFTDRDGTLRRLHRLQIASMAVRVTETRTGPLGCSNYDNLDTVSSVLVHSPENKVQLQGLQVILPVYLRGRFIQAALNYMGCKSEGQFVCQAGDCWCQCSPGFPQCNCPHAILHALEKTLLDIREAWTLANQEFENSEEFQSFVGKLPAHYAVNTSVVETLWRADGSLIQRYRQLETVSSRLLAKAHRTTNKLFSLGKRCRTAPKIVLQRERPMRYWLSRVLSLLYCSEHQQRGVYSEGSRSCSCPHRLPPCQASSPCQAGPGARCASCAAENRTRCSGCNPGFLLTQGACRPAVADPTEPYLALESDGDLRDLELRYLLRRGDARLALRAVFVSSDVHVDAWFDPAWRKKRMLLTLKSNRARSGRVHVLLGVALRVCLSANSTLEPAFALFVNPFGGSHSESWPVPAGQRGYPDWQRTRLDGPPDCHNWTLTLGNRWKSFFETVHFYLRGRVREPPLPSRHGNTKEPGPPPGGSSPPASRLGNTREVGPPPGGSSAAGHRGNATEPEATPASGGGYMKVSGMQLFGYSVHFDPEAIQDLILQVDYPYTQGSQDSALLQLLELRQRVNRLSPPGAPPVDLFGCLLRHRLKMAAADVARILSALHAFAARQPDRVPYEATKLCS